MYKKYAELLLKHNTTSYKIAKATGLSNGTLSDWKNGLYTPKVQTLQKISSYFGVPITYFLDVDKDTST